MKFFIWLLVIALMSINCIAQPSNKDIFYLYLIGDAGEPTVSNAPYKKIIQSQLAQNQGVSSAAVYLGDNVYPRGLADEDDKLRSEGEEILRSQIDNVKGVDNIYFVPGNHDWKRGRVDGLEVLLNQAAFIDSLNNGAIQFLPQGGCPGSVEVALSDQLVLVIIDSQWWLHPWDKPSGEESDCEFKSSADVIAGLEEILRRNEGKQIVVAAHHPLYTYGEHGGTSRLKEHIFPLTDVNKSLYIPLPILGSIYPLYRKIFGSVQDISHPAYREFRTSVENVLKNYPRTIFAAGHEHSLQYISKDSVHHVVSGSGSKHTYVKQKGYSKFAEDQLGFARVAIQANNQVRIEYYAESETNPIYQLYFEIREPANSDQLATSESATVVKNASNQYAASAKKMKWLGENYRDVWVEKIEVPVFDFENENGELRILKQGGGQQTLSLRLEDPKGQQFTLRSIEKFPEKAIPETFRETFAKDLVQDQISASHPYAAIVIPPLADAAGIYHANPKIVWLTDDPRLGNYRKTFANRLMLYEERPEGKAKGMDFFGNADDIESTFKVIDKLAKDNDNQVDQRFVLRSRLFDLWIGDWDRHDDQWRWAEFDKKKGKLYRPIPRDRDQAFFVNEGRIPKMFSKRWALPKLQGFDYELDWPPGFMFNARYFDRSFLTGLSEQDWVDVADSLTNALTDEAIENAIHQWPKPIFDLHGEEVIKKLKARRTNLKNYALEHYRFLAKEVTIVGSDKHERFEVEYLPNGSVKVEVFKTSKEGEKEKKLYERIFKEDETQEVRLQGLDGHDNFVFTGENKTSIKVRVIGGKGEDHLTSDAREKPIVYDKTGGLIVEAGSRIHDRRSDSKLVNEYNRREFKYNLLAPLIFGNYNVDDGIFLGGGFLSTTHGFRKDPFKTRHLFLGSYAINTSSFNFNYKAEFTHLVGKWNGEIDLDVKSPNFVNNFFGLGNESVFDKNIDENPAIDVDNAIDYYRLRFKQWSLDLRLTRKIGAYGFFKIGPTLQLVELERPSKDRFVKDFETTLPEPILEDYKYFTGLSYSWGIDNRNNKIFTTRGLYFEQTSQWMNEFNSTSINAGDFGFHTASLAFYQSFRFPARLTFATRVSGGITRGDYQIYQSQILDGRTEVRGFRKTRFYGDSKLVFNNEIRFKLGEIHSYIMPANIGMLGFFDIGRVWYKDSTGIDPTSTTGKSNVWHKGFGGGFWFTPYNLAVVSLTAGHSVEGTLAYFRLGFLF
ncbi:MAG: BamA/TamA family outer membrane protein [Cyclobacteriaceae bacterium]